MFRMADIDYMIEENIPEVTDYSVHEFSDNI
jgi:hypothetical protein